VRRLRRPLRLFRLPRAFERRLAAGLEARRADDVTLLAAELRDNLSDLDNRRLLVRVLLRLVPRLFPLPRLLHRALGAALAALDDHGAPRGDVDDELLLATRAVENNFFALLGLLVAAEHVRVREV